MAKITVKPTIELAVSLELTEAEAGFLEGMSGFDHNQLLEHIRQFCGKHYTEDDHTGGIDGAGFLSLMATCRKELPGPLELVKKTRAGFQKAMMQIPIPLPRSE